MTGAMTQHGDTHLRGSIEVAVISTPRPVGAKRISDLEIDVDKDFQVKGITNLKQVAASMSKGDIVAKDTTILVRIPPGPVDYVLTSRGALQLPTWAPAGGALKYYFPVLIQASHAEAKPTVDQSISRTVEPATAIAKAYDDQPGLNIRRLDKAITQTKTHVIVPVDQSTAKTITAGREGGFWVTPAVGGAVLDDAGVQTNYTSQINEATVNDVKLLPDAPLQVNDAFYFGLARVWDQLWLNIGTAGEGNWALTEEYWNGAWVALTMIKDDTNQFMNAGTNIVKFTRPGDWALTTIQGMNLYWMRFRVASVVAYTIQPLGTQGWCEVLI